MVLEFLIKLAEVSAPSPYSYYKVGILLGMRLRLEKSLAVYGVYLKLMSAKLNECLNELSYLLFAILVTEYGIVKLYGEGSAVTHL